MYLGIDNVSLLGDFNARTGHISKVIDDSIHDDDITFGNFDSCIIPKRVTQDNLTNNLGHGLISLCKASHFIIANRPDMTFAVDWALSNNYLLSIIANGRADGRGK